ncbi:hypothetical protein EPJ64_05625 [Brachyspira aalborgi]|jgi:hypothetical protein|uniref:DUF4468 domain-containing protein n=1 Tax=Brachyspira aalborgi TaxID=29522 RepID=A0A5C8D0Z7_9SPIR|nr:hypothetical protein [Brachyspira aalborgi]CCY75967.1 putative uncharacterized protein [Brachyspira sp. CAG:700]TXJ15692.1 hypothetical protein EPJ77_05475 [Brachyspira aalborgi]TXJ18966.1 hypothetical protein EPJ64_05625 [Brachyspira aalborgi]TXJ25082.1 hypothetical protein EPJ73_06305 [Brachyspira aalborgi]TXJ32327.1 hypothetical protein EPJ71_09560 [Brachyspira aalborgi]
MKRIISSMFIFLIFNISLFSEQKIFISTKLKGDNLRKSILNWIKNKSIKDNDYKIFDNGLIYLFFKSDRVINEKSLCFDINFNLEYDKFIVDFSNTKLLNIETKNIEDLKFNIWDTLMNSGWFREYNNSITQITKELENIINE